MFPNVRLLIFTIYFAYLASSAASRTRECHTTTGRFGYCTKLSECSKLPKTFPFLTRLWAWSTCGSPLIHICCPVKHYPGCGIATTGAVPVSNTLSRMAHSREGRIVNGAEASIANWPWMAAVGNYNVNRQKLDSFCGGVLITRTHVLTAAHCVCYKTNKPESNFVQLGSHQLQPKVPEALTLKVTRVFCHGEYQPPSMYHDVAILEVENNTYTYLHPYITPICLPLGEANNPSNGGFRGQMVNFAGWGTKGPSSKRSDVLLEIQITVENRGLCNTTMYNKLLEDFPEGISDEIICARDRLGSSDACKGDSGGPLTYRDPKSGLYTAIGIASAGKGCGVSGHHGIYIKVAPYVDWIYKTIGLL